MSDQTSPRKEDQAATPVNPPPLMAIDQPNPPNVVISKCTAMPLSSSSVQFTSPVTTTTTSNQFMLNTRQMVTASRLDPDLLLTSCASNRDIDDVDLDRMYMEAMLEDFKSNVSR